MKSIRTLLGFMLVSSASGFADNLVAGNMGCMTDLSTEEVIMNNQVKSAAESDHPEIFVGWKNPGDLGDYQTGPIVVNEVPAKFQLALVIPESSIKGVQYVLETTPGAKFDMGACDNEKRIAARVFKDPGSILIVEKHQPIQVWAGWATGHEAVRLTEVLQINSKDSGNVNTPPEAAQKVDMQHKAFEEAAAEAAQEDQAIEDAVHDIEELEEAEQNERRDVQDELGDDDAQDVGDLAQTMQNLKDMQTDPELRRKFIEHAEKLKAARHNHRRHKDHSVHHQEKLEDMRQRIQDKKGFFGGHLDNEHWDKVKDRLKHHPKFLQSANGQAASIYQKRQDELDEKRRELLAKQPKEVADMLRDMKTRGEALKVHLDEKKAKAAKHHSETKEQKKATLKEMPKFGDTNYWSHLREQHEQQHEFDAVQVLFAFLFLIAANFIVIQVRAIVSSRQKGRRNL